MNTMITDAEIDARLDVLHRNMVASGQHNGGMVGVAWNRAVYRMASRQPATVKQSLTAAPEAGVTRAAVEAELEKVGAQQKKRSLWVVTTRELVSVVDALATPKPEAGNPVSVGHGAAAAVHAGWKLVPIEPNWDMRNEGREFLIDGTEKEPERLAYFLWKTMINAAPEVE